MYITLSQTHKLGPATTMINLPVNVVHLLLVVVLNVVFVLFCLWTYSRVLWLECWRLLNASYTCVPLLLSLSVGSSPRISMSEKASTSGCVSINSQASLLVDCNFTLEWTFCFSSMDFCASFEMDHEDPIRRAIIPYTKTPSSTLYNSVHYVSLEGVSW